MVEDEHPTEEENAADLARLPKLRNVVQLKAAPSPGYEEVVRPDIEDFLDRDTHRPEAPEQDEPLAFYDDI